MILKIVRYAHTNTLEATWTDAKGNVSRCQSYADVQMQSLRDDIAKYGGNLAEHQALIAEVEAAIVPPRPPRAEKVRADLVFTLAAEYERRMAVIAAGYPASERESWPVQTQEARLLLADASAAAPWIDAAAAARGLDRLVLAQRIAAKDDAYRVIHGLLTGARQAIEDRIDAAGSDVAALQAIDVMAGWPSAE
ncbi:hypothetical protein [Paracidovorax oryzae]|uniref:hypothetical protein n=1 Tax=Paracidovorax oryzae TaxID=862720 RepID=UPI0003706DA5|nr:hypothetical protein [Paracidovorax oryzae]